MKKIAFLVSTLLFLIGSIALAQDKPTLMLFWGEGCPHCETEKGYIAELQQEYDFELKQYEIYYNKDNQKLMDEMAQKFNTSFNGVPVVIIGNDYFMGADKAQTERLLKKYTAKEEIIEQEVVTLPKQPITIEQTQIIEQEKVVEETPVEEPITEETIAQESPTTDKTTKLFGKEISLKSVGPVIFGILLGLADGVNPCMFGVLIFLLTYLVSIGSKKKVLYSGLIFVVTTFALYFGIMYLMHKLIFSTMMFLPYIAYIKYGIGILAILMGLIEIKDFFWYGKGVSLAIPKFMKPTLEYITMKGTYMSAFILAVLASFVELPCTIGIPLAYVGAVGNTMNIFGALALYNIFFILPLLFIILGIYRGFSMFKSGDQEISVNKLSNKKLMRLFAGIILVGIGILFLMRIF